MSRLLVCALPLAVVTLGIGCGAPAQPTQPAPKSSSPVPDLLAISNRHSSADPAVLPPPARPVPNSARRPAAPPLPVAGVWVPSGWMGDAHPMYGALSYRVTDSDPPAEEWMYDPGCGQQRWAAVAYQWPDLNFGEVRGKDLSGKGYDRLTFKARAKDGIVRVQFKSGGHTTRDARYPASYESTTGPISLGAEWQEITLLLGSDLSNVPVAFAVVFSEQLAPRGGAVQIRDAAFRGPTQ